MSAKCKCINSFLQPHRVDMCLIYGSKKEKVVVAEAERPIEVPFAEVTTAPLSDCGSMDEELPNSEIEDLYDEDISNSGGLPLAARVAEFAVSNAALVNGNERCDCFMFNISKHRKSKCAWKQHVGIGVSGAAVAVGAAVLASVLLGGESRAAADDPGDGVENSSSSEDTSSMKIHQNDSNLLSPRTLEDPLEDWRQGDAEVPTVSQKSGGQAVGHSSVREEDQEDEHATAARLAFQEVKRREREEICARLYSERVAEQKRRADQRLREDDERTRQWVEQSEFDLDTFTI